MVRILNAKKFIIHQLIKKLTIPDVTMEIGNISLGKYTFCIKLAFNLIQLVPPEIEVINHVHGIIPQIKNIK